MIRAVHILDHDAIDRAYCEPKQKSIRALFSMSAGFYITEEVLTHNEVLRNTTVISYRRSGSRVDEASVAHAPRLELVLYGAGSVCLIVTDGFYDRRVRSSCAFATIAIPAAGHGRRSAYRKLRSLPAIPLLTRRRLWSLG